MIRPINKTISPGSPRAMTAPIVIRRKAIEGRIIYFSYTTKVLLKSLLPIAKIFLIELPTLSFLS